MAHELRPKQPMIALDHDDREVRETALTAVGHIARVNGGVAEVLLHSLILSYVGAQGTPWMTSQCSSSMKAVAEFSVLLWCKSSVRPWLSDMLLIGASVRADHHDRYANENLTLPLFRRKQHSRRARGTLCSWR